MLGFFLSTTRLLLCLTLGHFLRTLGRLLLPACLLFGLALSHLLRPLYRLLLGAYLLFFSGTACLLLRTLHFSLLLPAQLLFSPALRHFLLSLCRLLLGAHLLFFGGTACLFLRALHLSLLLAACLFLSLALCHLLRAAFGFLLRLHLLLFNGTAGGFLLLALLHGCGFSLLADALGLRCGGLVGRHALSRGTLLLHCHLLLLGGCRSGLLACFFSLGGGLVGRHALLLGRHRLLLRSGGLHTALFRFGIHRGLFSSFFLCQPTFLHLLLLALLHGGRMGLFPASMHLSSFSLGGHRLL